MSDQRIPISQLSETQTAPDASYIAIDDGSLTKKITVENFNSTSTASAQSYAEQAAASAQTVEDNIATSAAQIREATLAAREATQASTSATASATSAYDSASLAQNYSVNAATSAGQAMNAADTVAQGVTESKEHAEDSEAWAVGKRNGSDVPSSDDTYHNNAKYYSDSAIESANTAASHADRAEAAADSINIPDTSLMESGIAAESKATGLGLRDIYDSFEEATVTGELVTFENGAGGAPVKQITTAFETVQTGTGDPGPDNVRPIVGRDSVTVSVAEKNLLQYLNPRDRAGIIFEVDTATGAYHISGTSSAAAWSDANIDANVVKKYGFYKAGTYVFSITPAMPSPTYAQIYVWYPDNTHVALANHISESATITIPKDGWLFPRFGVPAGNTVDFTVYPMIRLASDTDDTFEPYVGKSYTVSFPSGIGPVYSGTLQINDDGSGQLTVDSAYYKPTASIVMGTPTQSATGNRAGFALPGITVAGDTADLVCSCGTGDIAVNASSGWTVGTCAIYKGTTQTYWRYIFPTSITTGAAALQYLLDHDCEIVCKIAEPITYTLTAPQVKTLLGYNAMWADTDGSFSVTYRIPLSDTFEDVNLQIEDILSALPSLDTKDAIALASDTDLNTLKTYACYKVVDATIAASLQNTPDGYDAAGRLYVMTAQSASRILQVLVEAKVIPLVWIRYYNGSSWKGWKRFAYLDEIITSDGELINCGWVVNSITAGYPRESTNTLSNKRILSDYIFVGQNTKIGITDSDYNYSLSVYDLDKVFTGNIPTSGGWLTSATTATIPNDCFIRITVRKRDDSVLTESDIPTIVAKLKMEYYNPTVTDYLLSVEDIPSYYNDQLSSAVDTIRSNMNACGQNGDTFVFITDLHWDPQVLYKNRNARRSPALVKKIIEETGLRKIVFGGDYFTGNDDPKFEFNQMRLLFNAFDIKNTLSYPIMGNHDWNGYNTTTGMWDDSTSYAQIVKQCENYVQMGDDLNYYYDVASCKTRYICLNTHDVHSRWSAQDTANWNAQMTWLSSTLNSTPSGYKILVLMHIYYDVGSSSAGYPLTFSQQGEDVAGVCDTFNSGSSGKKVVAILSGHAHQDINTTTPGGIPVLLTDCDSSTNVLSGRDATWGTVGENCFDVVTLDYVNNKIKTVRIGRGGAEANRSINLYS